MEEIVRQMQRQSMEALHKAVMAGGRTTEEQFTAGTKKMAAGMFEREGAGDNQVARP